jgi:hypothetical protein
MAAVVQRIEGRANITKSTGEVFGATEQGRHRASGSVSTILLSSCASNGVFSVVHHVRIWRAVVAAYNVIGIQLYQFRLK